VKDADLKRWAETWDRARRELAILRRRDLARITDEQAKAAALDVLSIPLPEDLPARSGSGLVEQQRLFARLRQPLSSRGTTLLPTPSRRDTPLKKEGNSSQIFVPGFRASLKALGANGAPNAGGQCPPYG
jgi:hypothetical protein